MADGYDEVKIYHCHELKRHYYKNLKGKVLNVPQNQFPLLQARWEVKERQAAISTETPQISTGTEQEYSCATGGEKRYTAHGNSQSGHVRNCRTTDRFIGNPDRIHPIGRHQ
ncbi:MAG: hypothetical protein K2O88_06745 [Paramuribaculum sp.]|nr:hypothetical protein [Paramuribaculum sp.]